MSSDLLPTEPQPITVSLLGKRQESTWAKLSGSGPSSSFVPLQEKESHIHCSTSNPLGSPRVKVAAQSPTNARKRGTPSRQPCSQPSPTPRPGQARLHSGKAGLAPTCSRHTGSQRPNAGHKSLRWLHRHWHQERQRKIRRGPAGTGYM